jgi:putative mRNA 3-end processing factor
MSQYVDVLASGAVLLGDQVVCDGFVYEHPYRVQTHIHDDHMDGFDSSKGFQTILMSKPTKDLLVAEFNADLDIRQNIHALRYDHAIDLEGVSVSLSSSGHMLGAAQVVVETSSGQRLGYSGDFQWPLDEVIKVDQLVVDSTYGSPKNRRAFSQEAVEEMLLELVIRELKRGPVHIRASRGTVQRALQVLSGNVPTPLLGSQRLIRNVEVFRDHGYAIDPVVDIGSPEGRAALDQGHFVRLYTKGDKFPVDPPEGMTLHLSAYMTDPEEPLLQFSERSCRLAMSNHADFEGTIEYVRATGARFVVTDNTRGGHGIELAQALSYVGIEARASSNAPTRSWGA